MRVPAAPLPTNPNTSSFTFPVVVALGVSAFVLAGCGGAAATKAAEPVPSAAGAADEVDSAQSELDRGEWRITELFGPPPGVRSDASPPTDSGTPAASASPVAPNSAPAPTELSGGESKPGDACAVACSALQSMDRAARHICEMSGPDEPRCSSARDRVKNANDRVAAHCTCGI